MSARKQENFYRRDPLKALHGMIGLSMDEKAAYNTMLDLMYASWKPLRHHDKDDVAFIANWVGCAPQKLNPIIARLIEKGRISRVEIGGRFYLTDAAFEAERAKVKGEKSGRTQENSGEVGEKSGEVEANIPVLDTESEQNQQVVTLEKIREDKTRKETTQLGASAQNGWPEERAEWIDILLAETCCADPNRDIWPRSTVSVVLGWATNGFELQDALAGIHAVMARPNVHPKSWGYFTEAVAQAYVNRTKVIPLPTAANQQSSRPDAWTQAIDNIVGEA